jgi:hypothetical protein
MSDISYVCPFRDATGEVHEVVVSLSDNEMGDVLRHRARGHACGNAHGPLARAYAWHRAVKLMPAEFAPLFDQAHPIVVQ